MFSTGDLLPQQSGSASIGVNFQNNGPTNRILPYNNIHFVSGVIHDPILGVSGVIRFAKNLGQVVAGTPIGTFRGFELSADGGNTFGLRIGHDPDGFFGLGPHAIISSQPQEGSRLYILTSGNFETISQSSCSFTALQGIDFNSPADIIFNAVGSPTASIDFVADANITASCQHFVLLGNNDPTLDAITLNATNGGNIVILGNGLGEFNTFVDANITFDAGATSQQGGQIELNAFASSGRLQFRFGPHQAWHAKLTHSSTGGPAGDGFWPLPHSGQIAQMIAQATPGGSVDLQAAYDNGNEIDHRKDLIGYKGVLIRETTPGVGGFLSNADIRDNKPGKYGIAVSGHTLTPNDINSYGFSSISSLGFAVSSSGTPTSLSRNLFFGYIPTNAELLFFNTNGSTRFGAGDTTGTGLGGQLDFRPFAGSGRLEYRFGPHQAWYEKMTHAGTGGPFNDGYWPIAHSGQMLEQIARREKNKSMTIERPAVNNDLTWFYTNQAVTITEVQSVVRGSFDASGSFAIRHSTNRNLSGTELTSAVITCANRTTGQITTSFANANIPADSWVWIGVSGVSGVVTTQLHVSMHFN